MAMNSNALEQNRATLIVDQFLHIHGTELSLTLDTSLGDTVINVAAGHGLSQGSVVGIEENHRWYQGEVVSINVNAITLDSPLDYAYTTGHDIMHIHDTALNVDGSTASVIFHANPPKGVIWDITRIIFLIEDNAAMDTSKFGGIAAITNGIIVRKKNDICQNIFNIKSNGDFALRSYDVEYDSKAPAGLYGIRCRCTFSGEEKRGTSMRLYGDIGDQIEVRVQDDLTDLSNFKVVIQGHQI